MALLRELDAADAFRWAWANDEASALEAVVALWRAGLAHFAVTPGEDRAEETAQRVGASLVEDRVLTALDLGLLAERSPRVRDVLRAADSDPYRDAGRDALVARDGRVQPDLAVRPDALARSARFAIPLGVDARIPVGRRREVTESALRDRPGDMNPLMALAETWFPAAVTVVLYDASGTTISDATAVVTVRNDDGGAPDRPACVATRARRSPGAPRSPATSAPRRALSRRAERARASRGGVRRRPRAREPGP